MISQTPTEGAPTLAGREPASEFQAAAEAYHRNRATLSSLVPEERTAAVYAMVESGSDAVFPLLRTIEDDDDLKVANAALWSLLWLSDDLLCGKPEESDSPDAVINRGRLTEPYLRLGLEAVTARSVGGSPASAAYGWVHYLGRRSHDAGLRFLSDLVRLAPDLDPELPDVLRRMARRHPLPWIRPHGLSLIREYEAWRGSGEESSASRLARSLALRREATQWGEGSSETTLVRLVEAATVDPDRTVRHLAGARLYHLVREGAVVPSPLGLEFKDEEIRCLFFKGRETLQAHPNPVESLKRVADQSPQSRRCVLRLVVCLRPLVGGVSGAELDGFVRLSMRDADRGVRREATATARVASSDLVCVELTGRLREQLRKSPPVMLLVFPILWFASLGLSFNFRSVWWVSSLPHLINAAFMGYVALRDRGGKHGITHGEYLETLSALEPIADSAPEKLLSTLPELRKLAGPGVVDRAVRVKARELLAKVHEATLHELPIAATAPAVEPDALPIPDAAPEVREGAPP